MNPFNATWSISPFPGSFSSPSMYGALPYPGPSGAAGIHTFQFTSFNPNIFNCTVIGPESHICYTIVTNDHMPGYTVIKDRRGTSLTLVEWQLHPLIEIRGSLSKQHIHSWLALSADKSARLMSLRGQDCIWVPQEGSINLYTPETPYYKLLAKISRVNGVITLEVAHEVMQRDILDAVVSAALVLQCGRNID